MRKDKFCIVRTFEHLRLVLLGYQMNSKSVNADISTIIKRLKRRYIKEMHTSLQFNNGWNLLVATMLSAQSQDAQVNRATPGLFRRYQKIESYTKLRPAQLYKYIGSLGLYRNKAKNIVKAAKYIKEHFNGRIPDRMEDLIMLPGVGRKTANVVLANYFGNNSGIAVDTHCITVSRRLFLYRTKSAEKIERYLMELVPRKEWGNITHLFIALGRDVCTARSKYCNECVLNDICPSSDSR